MLVKPNLHNAVILSFRQCQHDIELSSRFDVEFKFETRTNLAACPPELRVLAPAVCGKATHVLWNRSAIADGQYRQFFPFEDHRVLICNVVDDGTLEWNWLSCYPRRLIHRFALMNQCVSSFHSTDDDILKPILIQIDDADLATDTGIVGCSIRKPTDAIWTTNQFEPIDNCTGVPHRTALMVRIVSLTGNNVLKSITIHVLQIDRMQFAENDTVRIVLGLGAKYVVANEFNVCAIAFLFEPC